MKLKTLALCAAVAGTWAHDNDDDYDPFDNSDLGPVMSTGYAAELEYCEDEGNYKCDEKTKPFTEEVINLCKEAIASGREEMNKLLCNNSANRAGGQVHLFQQNKENGGFQLGKISIPSFRLSCKNSKYRKWPGKQNRDEGFCGIVVYDVGHCTLRACRRIKNGYVIIVHREKYMHLPFEEPREFKNGKKNRKNFAHSRAAKWFFGEYPTELRKVHGMRFAGFSVKSDGQIGYGSNTFNRVGYEGASADDKDDNSNSNAYESAIIYMMSEKWKAKTEGVPEDKYVGGVEVDWEGTQKYFRENRNDIRASYMAYANRKGNDKAEEIPQSDVFEKEFGLEE